MSRRPAVFHRKLEHSKPERKNVGKMPGRLTTAIRADHKNAPAGIHNHQPDLVPACSAPLTRDSANPSLRAASIRPCPAMIIPATSTSTRLLQPHSRIDVAICSTYAGLWVRALQAYGSRRSIAQRSMRSAGQDRCIPRSRRSAARLVATAKARRAWSCFSIT